MPAPSLSYVAASILMAVSNGFRYGFDIMDIIGLPSGTVYPALRRLEQGGLVSSKWEKAGVANRDQRPPRKYYSITRAGEAVLAAAMERYPLLENAMAGLPLKSKE